MYIVRRKRGREIAFKTYEGWDAFSDKPLEIGNAQRFTKGEAKRNVLPDGEEWVWYGCYKELDK